MYGINIMHVSLTMKINNLNKLDKRQRFSLTECSKNDKLKPIIYRSLTSKEENFFLRYLMNCQSPKTQDLHVYYHILRGHYIEAFESHELTIPTQMDNLGLHGKQVSSTRERIMSMLSEIMPELTRNLINLCRKEKSNVWKKGMYY